MRPGADGWNHCEPGIGLSEIVAAVAYEERIGETVTFTIEGGVTGGMVLSGMDFGRCGGPGMYNGSGLYV